MRKFKCRCIKDFEYLGFKAGDIYVGTISAYETGVHIMGPMKNQDTYFAQAYFEEYFEIV